MIKVLVSDVLCSMERRISTPLIVFGIFLNTIWLTLGIFRRSYDAPTHIFFASYYNSVSWFNTWNYKWYGGFDQMFYPPLVHQLVALIAYAFDYELSYAIVQLLAIAILLVGIYRFARIWLPPVGANISVLAAIFLTSLTITIHVFGQLPTTWGLAFLLNAIPFLHRWVREGGFYHFVLGQLCFLVVLVSHHVTVFFGAPFFILPVLLGGIFGSSPSPADTRTMKTIRSLIFLVTLFLFSDLIGSPFIYSVILHSPDQIPIFHASRANLFQDPTTALNFLVAPFSFLIPLLPLLLFKAFAHRSTRILAFCCLLLILFGLGGTTPLPALVLGKYFGILTFDRFTLWSTVVLAIFVGLLLKNQRSILVWCTLVLVMISCQTLVLLRVIIHPVQPEFIDMKPIARVLDDAQTRQHRYLTLDFGNQFAWLGVLSNASSIDGNYHAARSLPELKASGIEALDGAKYFGDRGLETLSEVIANAQTHKLKHVLTRGDFYDEFLTTRQFTKTRIFEGDVSLWQLEGISPLTEDDFTIKRSHPVWFYYLWGAYPLLLLALILCLFFYFRSQRGQEPTQQGCSVV